ncbi:hypothetical protein EDB81DRAFT_156836 [Dactylonectria macrodidyma]|uniref:Repetitive proline-rich cell wall protein n=1 Tax=Dactylonectria macrodidyma TaxID=307937 RepID=A0A9P9JNY7_9HYPO|nr:hypothetical protein EDB81DRAFT_156836 [Dactylonectria macrodidyma]
MKFGASLLLLATSALALLDPRGDDYYGGDGYGGNGYGGDHEGTKTLTTYTTVTTCPVTSTYTKEGTTYCVTELTTSTIVVTDCKGCVTTVQGPDVTKTEQEVEYTTYTTVCPVTETKYVEGKEVTVVYTTTSVVEEAIKSTVYDHVTYPGTTKTEVDVEYTTYTTVCPVTETKYVEGKEVTVVYTTTSVVEEAIKSTVYNEVTKPGATYTNVATDYSTYTTVCPVTETKTVEGEVVTVVYTTTSVVTEAIKTTVYDHVEQPDTTKTAVDVAYSTYTTVCPVTETKTVEGEVITVVYTTTSIVKEAVQTTIYEQVHGPDTTKTSVDVAYVTQTSLCPVTETKTVNGEVITKVYTSTEYIVQKVYKTINEYETIYETATGYEVETHYSKVYYTVGGGTVVETIVPKTTIAIPETEVVTVPAVTVTSEAAVTPTSAPVVVPTNAAAANQPAFALMAGIAGALALL